MENLRRIGILLTTVLCLACAQDSERESGLTTQGSGKKPNFIVMNFQQHAPKITIAPLNHTVPHNSRITFFCQASGYPAPTVSWHKGGRALGERRSRYISKMDYSSALTLESVGDKQSGVYQCVADNGVESPAVANATLSVYRAGAALPEGFPAVTETADPISLIEKGFPMTLKCTVTGDPSPQVIWYKDKVPVDVYSSNRVSVSPRPGVAGSHDLRIIATESEDQGDYVCMSRNTHGTVYSSVIKVYVKVRRYAPRFTIRPDVLYNVMAGGNLNITCVAVGSPMPYVWWVKEGDKIGEPSNSPIGRNVLQLKNIRESVNYTCQAQSILGLIFVNTQVEVQALPGAPETIWVNSITSLSAVILWTKSPQTTGPEAKLVDPQYVVQYRQIFTGEESSEEWSEQGEDVIGTRLSYTLTGLQPFTIYEAAVVPFSEYGRGTPSKSTKFKTTEAAPDSAPYDVEAKAVSENTALVQWKAPIKPNGDIEGYRVFYCLASKSDQPIETWSLYPTVNTLAVLDNLIRDAEYSVSVQARNRIGTGPSSPPIQFTVTPGALSEFAGIPGAPQNIMVTAKTSRTLTLAWERPTGNDAILSYEVYINNSRNRQAEVRSVVPPDEEYMLEGLFPNTVYNIKVTARSSHGEGPHSTIIQVKTKEAAAIASTHSTRDSSRIRRKPSAPPLNIQADPPKPDASTQIQVVWEPPPSIQANGQITGYTIYYVKDVLADNEHKVQQISDPTETSVVLNDLEVWTKYRIWMKASTSVGDSPPSVPIVARSGEAVPDAPKGFSVHVINSTAVLLQWRKPTDREARGHIRGYQIFQSRVGSNGFRIGDPKVINLVNGSLVNHTIGGLNYSTKYVYQIRAFTVAGDGEASGTKTVVTFGAATTVGPTIMTTLIDTDKPVLSTTQPQPLLTTLPIQPLEHITLSRRHGGLMLSTPYPPPPPPPLVTYKKIYCPDFKKEKNTLITTPSSIQPSSPNTESKTTAVHPQPSSVIVTKPDLPASISTSKTGPPTTGPPKTGPPKTGPPKTGPPTTVTASTMTPTITSTTAQPRLPITTSSTTVVSPDSTKTQPRATPITTTTHDKLFTASKLPPVATTTLKTIMTTTRSPSTTTTSKIATGTTTHKTTSTPSLKRHTTLIPTAPSIPTKSTLSQTALTHFLSSQSDMLTAITSTKLGTVPITDHTPPTTSQSSAHAVEAGVVQTGMAVSVTSRSKVPSAPVNFRLEIVDQEPPRVRVTWEPPVETHGQLRSYRLMWGKRHEKVFTNTIPIGRTKTSYIAEKMMKGTEYEFQLQAQNDENYGEAAVAHIRTEDGVPSGSPQNITTTYHTDTSAVVSWRELDPALRNGIITMYQVRIQDEYDSIDLRAENTSETSIIIENLKPDHRYLIQVVAYTSAGAGPTSYRYLYNTRMTRPPPPLDVQARRVNRTAIEVTWRAPPRTVVRGYKIRYSTQDLGDDMRNWKEVPSNQPTPVYVLTDLDPLRAYAIKVQVINTAGEVGQASAEAIVNEVIPLEAQVRELTATAVTSTAVLLKWSPPTKPNPSNYRIRYIGLARNSGKVHEGNSLSFVDGSERTIEGLRPDYNYTFEVLVKYAGEDSYTGKSEISVATKPVETPRLKDDVVAIIALSRDENNFDEIYIIVALKSEPRTPDQITLSELQAPSRGKREVDTKPYIAAKFDGNSAPSHFKIGDGNKYGEYLNKELSPDYAYKAFVRVVVSGDEFSSPFSRPFTSEGPATGAVSNTEAVTEPESDSEKNKLTLLLGPIIGGLVIIVIIIIIVVVIRRNKTHKKEEAPEPTKVIMDQPPVYPNDPVELRRMQFSTPGMQSHPPIPVLQLSGHIEQLRAHDNLKFSQEYESIEPGQQFTWDNSNLEYNKPKNRYANVIAYDHSRVVLQPMDGAVGSDYINANYMDGYRKQNAYISTQGPLPETFGDFWRMVWEQRSATIVMMTKLEERSRVKCDTYWPLEGTDMYGPIVVTLTDCMELATYTVRTFQIEREGWAEKREVRQFQFTAWPDHGVPDYPTPLLIFMKRVKAATPSDSGPMVVHCSAGVGRTGAFIVIDAMLERIKHEKTVDIYGHVTCLRAQRNYMVQTEDQYIFIHDALLEAVLSGNTEIPARNLYSHIQKLAQPDGSTTGMEKEFQTLSNAKINPSRFASANLPVNKFKNRLVNVLPYEANRVCLLPIRGVDGSDYINASFIDGYRFKKAYIATQGPLAETVEDFWRMIWEHNSTIIVMLTKTKEMGREKCHQYWPETRSARYQYFVVDPHAEYSMPEYTLREFKVTDARDGQSRTIRLFQFNEWPEQGNPTSGMSFIQFIGQVHKTKEQFGQEGPIAVHCSAGVGRTGVFISLSIILERMRYEGVVDMFQTVKMLRTQRQGMVQTVEQYAFCYQAALEHLASFDHY